MERTKIIKKIAIGSICLSVVALIVLNIYQHKQIKRFSRVVKQEAPAGKQSNENTISGYKRSAQEGAMQDTTLFGEAKEADVKEITEVVTFTGKEKEPNKDEVDDLSYQLDAAEEELAMVDKQLSDEEVKKAIKIEYERRMTIEAKKRDLDRFKANLDSEYGPLFMQLNLPSDRLNAFKQLLIDRRAEAIDISVEMMEGGGSMYKMSDNPVKWEEYDIKISQLLGDEGYEKYQTYEESSYERYQVSDFIKSLSSGDMLTKDQQQDLIYSMHQNRNNIKSELDNYRNQDDTSQEIDEEEIALMMKRTELTDQAYLEAAQNILSASQLELFKTYLKNKSDMVESSLKLQAKMSTIQTTQESNDEKSE